jgi:hypothetical protein
LIRLLLLGSPDMSGLTRRGFLELSALGVGGLALGGPEVSRTADGPRSLDSLRAAFENPDRKYSIRPFWFWNGELTGQELSRQIRQMAEHGVYGAYVHNRDGLQTPYLSEAWWKVLGEALAAAEEASFSLCLVDDFEWPSGEARDYWLPGVNKSRVVAANSEYRMQRMREIEVQVRGPRRVTIPLTGNVCAVVAGRRSGPNRLEEGSLQALPFAAGVKQVEWEAPDGDWVVFTYVIEPAMGQPDHGTVDLMSREAVAKYIEIYYDQLNSRCRKFLGRAMPATFADHEGNYGSKLPWTPKLFETFRHKAGYDLTPLLPGLRRDIGPNTEKVRIDLLDVISDLYSENFFGQVNEWCLAHHVEHSGHVWEESLFFGPAFQGDFFRILRAMGNPGCDTLVEWGRQSVWLKEVASVAEFEGRHVVCENQGVQGEDSYLSPERMRRVSNCLAAWNIGEFIPHAFDYDLARVNFPPDWFRSQPYLPWFRAYADQMRRVSFMNRESRSVADLLLYYPQVSIWGQAAPAFAEGNIDSILENRVWTPDAVETNETFTELKLRLSEERLDYLVADDHYLARSRCEGRVLQIENSSFRALILPPMSAIRRSSAAKVREFFQAGGIVIVLRRLPSISAEGGRHDRELKAIWNNTFDTTPTIEAFRLRKNEAGGRSYWIAGTVDDLLAVVHQALDPDVEVVGGPRDHLYILHKRREEAEFYWIVNDSAESRTATLRLGAQGRPERWDPASGRTSTLFYQTQGRRTIVRLSVGPWDGAYVVFDPGGPLQTAELVSSNADDLQINRSSADEIIVRARRLVKGDPLAAVLKRDGRVFQGEYSSAKLEPLEIKGDWNVTVEAAGIPLPYVETAADPADQGVKEQWFRHPEKAGAWHPLWLSPMNYALRKWSVIGPFPNLNDQGLEHAFPPEQGVDDHEVWRGAVDEPLEWQQIDAAADKVHPAGGAWNLGTMEISGGRYADGSFVVNYAEALRLNPVRGTIYAQTNVYSPSAMEATAVLATPNPHALFVNGSKVYSRWLRPLYNELNDGFATFIPVRLNAGWNSCLLKFLHNPQNPQAGHFTFRIQSPGGSLLEGLTSSWQAAPDAADWKEEGSRWLQFAVPSVAGSLRLPALKYPWDAFIDSKPADAQSPLFLRKGVRSVMLRVTAREILDRPFAFTPVAATMPLGSWMMPGLEHYSGTMMYEKSVSVPASLFAERVLLDCGDVGVCAEAWVNGKPAGMRAWSPYVFDVTEHLHAGENVIRIRIANTDANARATGLARGILQNLDRNGWIGPARLVPYVEREIRCVRT